MLRHGDANPVNHPTLNYSTVHNALMFVSVNLKKQQQKKRLHLFGRFTLGVVKSFFSVGTDFVRVIVRNV